MHRPIVIAALAVLVGGALNACAPIRVSSHVDRQVDFTAYRTFDWGEADALPAGDPRFERNSFFQDRMQGAVEREMARHGFERADRGGAPDVRIHFHAVVDRRMDVNALDVSRGYCVSADCQSSVVEYEEGSLIVDLVDARSNRLVWRGWAQQRIDDVLTNPDRLAKRIEEAVAGMFRLLPAVR